MKLLKADGSPGTANDFDFIANNDGSPALDFYQADTAQTYFQLVSGAPGSANLDAKSVGGAGNVDVGLWPQNGGGLYLQSETRSNWLRLNLSDGSNPITAQTGGRPYSQPINIRFTCQGLGYRDEFKGGGAARTTAAPPPAPSSA
jgi:hypothetical protein